MLEPTIKFTKLNVGFRKVTDYTTQHTLSFDIRDTTISQKWATALYQDYLLTDPYIEKQFMLHGWAYNNETPTTRTIPFMCEEMNFHITAVNAYAKEHNIDYGIDMFFDPATVSREQLNLIHHHFEVLIGQIWNVSDYYGQFDEIHKWSINNFNWLCHEMESQLIAYEAKSRGNSNSSVVICMNPIIRHDMSLEAGDWDNFELKDLEFGQVRMHYAQTGKTHREAWHDNDDDIFDSNITGIQYISGEFDINLNTTTENTDWNSFIAWLESKGLDVNDKTLALGWCVLADLDRSTWNNMTDMEIMNELWDCDDLVSIELVDENGNNTKSEWNYTWRDLYFRQKQELIDSVAAN